MFRREQAEMSILRAADWMSGQIIMFVDLPEKYSPVLQDSRSPGIFRTCYKIA
jgi:hypothetical protein